MPLQNNFDDALAHVLRFEGGYSDHPSDPGGATNLGITKADLERFRGHAVSKAEVKALTRDEAAEIYRRYYWAAAACDQLPEGIDLAVFDCAVNQGSAAPRAIPGMPLRLRSMARSAATPLPRRPPPSPMRS